MTVSDLDLLEAWRAGDEGAGSTLLRRHFDRVFVFFYSKVPMVAEDLTQETFLACLRERDRLRDAASFRAFLLGIARHRLLHYFRDHRRYEHRVDRAGADQPEPRTSPSRAVVAHEEQKLLLEALRSLPLELQLVLELQFWEDMTVAEMATVLEIPAGTVKSRLFRAREQLREAVLRLATDAAVGASTTTDLERWARTLRALLAPGNA